MMMTFIRYLTYTMSINEIAAIPAVPAAAAASAEDEVVKSSRASAILTLNVQLLDISSFHQYTRDCTITVNVNKTHHGSCNDIFIRFF